MVLPFNSQTCPIEWKPLDRCRKYTFDMSSQYTETWNGPTISANVFTRGNEGLNFKRNFVDLLYFRHFIKTLQLYIETKEYDFYLNNFLKFLQPIFRLNQIHIILGCVQKNILFATMVVHRRSMVGLQLMCVMEKITVSPAGTKIIVIRM